MSDSTPFMQEELAELAEKTSALGYIAEPGLLTNLWLMSELDRPLLLEGDAGVGKTQLGKTMAQVLNRPLIRLQCYEGLDVSTAVYEWNYQRQLISIRRTETSDSASTLTESDLFSDNFLLKRPLLQAIVSDEPTVLIIDEIDRADEEFEAFLLELLSEFQISIPELGTIKAKSQPAVILTSNGTRELSDALRRRCLYHYIDYPSFEKELMIVKARIPDIGDRLASQVVAFVQSLRHEDLRKIPGIAETLDWTAALLRLKITSLADGANSADAVLATLGCLLKTREDHDALPEVIVKKILSRAT